MSFTRLRLIRLPQIRLFNLILFIIPCAIWSIYLLAYWPGIMTFDSVAQWDQAMRFSFNDWHPVFSSLLIWFITRIWATPASVVIVQILFFSAVVSFTLQSFHQFGVPKWLLILESLLFALFLPNGMMSITIWKDVPYSICVLGLTNVIFCLINSHGKWISRWSHILLLSGFLIGTSLFRHNGIPVSLAALISLLVFFRNFRRPLIISSAIFLGVYFLIVGPVYQLLHVDPYKGQSIGVVFIHPIAAHVRAGTSFTKDDLTYINQIFPLSKGWDYNCYDATVLFYKGVNFDPVQRDPSRAINLFVRLTIENPSVTIKHFFCLSSFVWGLTQPYKVVLETVYPYTYEAPTNSPFSIYSSIIQLDSRLPEIKDLLHEWYLNLLSFDPSMIIWRPAIYLYVFLIAVAAFSIVSRNFYYLLLIVPSIIQSIVIMFTAQLQALRYQYSVYIISMLFVIPLLWSTVIKLKNKSGVRIEKSG